MKSLGMLRVSVRKMKALTVKMKTLTGKMKTVTLVDLKVRLALCTKCTILIV